jgi:hypothetical protein
MAKKQITKNEIKNLLERLKQSVIKSECWTCECFQGLISQLEMDSSEDISNLIETVIVPDENLHKCLGCKPCHPADLYTECLIKQRKSSA